MVSMSARQIRSSVTDSNYRWIHSEIVIHNSFNDRMRITRRLLSANMSSVRGITVTPAAGASIPRTKADHWADASGKGFQNPWPSAAPFAVGWPAIAYTQVC